MKFKCRNESCEHVTHIQTKDWPSEITCEQCGKVWPITDEEAPDETPSDALERSIRPVALILAWGFGLAIAIMWYLLIASLFKPLSVDDKALQTVGFVLLPLLTGTICSFALNSQMQKLGLTFGVKPSDHLENPNANRIGDSHSSIVEERISGSIDRFLQRSAHIGSLIGYSAFPFFASRSTSYDGNNLELAIVSLILLVFVFFIEKFWENAGCLSVVLFILPVAAAVSYLQIPLPEENWVWLLQLMACILGGVFVGNALAVFLGGITAVVSKPGGKRLIDATGRPYRFFHMLYHMVFLFFASPIIGVLCTFQGIGRAIQNQSKSEDREND